MDWQTLLIGLIPVFAGAVTSFVMTGLRKVSTWVNAQSSWIKQLIVLLIAFGVTQLSGLLGLQLPADALMWGSDVVNTVITALLSFGVYNIVPSKPTTDV